MHPEKLSLGKRGSTLLEEEVVKTRTRFSVFQAWYEHLASAKALGRFECRKLSADPSTCACFTAVTLRG